MSEAKHVADKKSWLSVVFGWVDVMLEALDPEFDLLKIAISALEKGIETYRTLAEGAEGDFLTAAMDFRKQLPTKMTTQLLMVDNFINAVRESSDQDNTLLQAYSQVTKLIAKTSSYRRAFNEYHVAFLNGTDLGDTAFYYSINALHQSPENVIWCPTPAGLDSCTVANFVHDLNYGCVSPQTPGLEHISMGVQLVINAGTGIGVQFACSAYTNPEFSTGCWWRGRLLHGSDCDRLVNQLKSWDLTWWPNAAVDAFCNTGIGPSTVYTAYHLNDPRVLQRDSCSSALDSAQATRAVDFVII